MGMLSGMGGRGKVEGIDLRRQHIIIRGGEEDTPRVLIHADEVRHHPVARGKLAEITAREMIEVPEAVALGPPDERPVLQEAVIIGQIDPASRRALLGEQDARCAGRRVAAPGPWM